MGYCFGGKRVLYMNKSSFCLSGDCSCGLLFLYWLFELIFIFSCFPATFLIFVASK